MNCVIKPYASYYPTPDTNCYKISVRVIDCEENQSFGTLHYIYFTNGPVKSGMRKRKYTEKKINLRYNTDIPAASIIP